MMQKKITGKKIGSAKSWGQEVHERKSVHVYLAPRILCDRFFLVVLNYVYTQWIK